MADLVSDLLKKRPCPTVTSLKCQRGPAASGRSHGGRNAWVLKPVEIDVPGERQRGSQVRQFGQVFKPGVEFEDSDQRRDRS